MKPISLLSTLLVAVALAVPASVGPAAAAPESRAGAGAGAEGAAEARYEVTPFHPRASDDPRLVAAWRGWKARGLATYTTVVTRGCFCPPEDPVRTEVADGSVTSVTFEGGHRQLRRTGHEMDELFGLLRRAYARADRLEVHYRQGVPRSIFIDWDRLVADEEQSLRVRTPGAPASDVAYPVTPFRLQRGDDPRLKAGWRAWRAQHPRSYVATTSRVAGEGEFATLRTSVRRGVVTDVSTVDAEGRATTTGQHGYEVERLYRLLRHAYAHADRVHVRYTDSGVPRRIDVDRDRRAVDDETTYRTVVR